MRNPQSLLSALTAASAALLISACATGDATRPSEGGSTPPAAEKRAASTAKIDWAALQKELSGALRGVQDAEVGEATADGIHLRIPVSNGFASGGSEPRPALTKVLDSLVAPLAARPGVGIKVIGHTDGLGSEMYNLKLSIQRAEAVMEYLRSRGIAFDRLSADGKGETEPIADNAKEATRARNRRVEIVLRAI
ncbi:lipoprotein attached to the membrane by a lipid anchor [Azoarcus olearius]|uniref:OmpA family protein n=1 Tax=Azoarcus sp. (strain BH72) TaxID=418699 RepID=UPI0008060E9B|nr:OmpA family protein [Azoarcus olearius]ANQ86360.1 lipoprotein attached to the membrane by a lipid anchor [Azoarcus olearius]